MARLPAATRESVPPEQVEEFDRIVETIGRVPPVGPYSARAQGAAAGRRPEPVHLRNESSLSLKTLELAMLVVARELDCQHIWERPRPCGPGRRRAGRCNHRAARPQAAAANGR